MSKRRATPAKPPLKSVTPEPTLVSLHAQEVGDKKAKILDILTVLEEEFRVAVDAIQARLRELV